MVAMCLVTGCFTMAGFSDVCSSERRWLSYVVVKELILKSSASEKVYSTKTEQLVIAFKALAL